MSGYSDGVDGEYALAFTLRFDRCNAQRRVRLAIGIQPPQSRLRRGLRLENVGQIPLTAPRQVSPKGYRHEVQTKSRRHRRHGLGALTGDIHRARACQGMPEGRAGRRRRGSLRRAPRRSRRDRRLHCRPSHGECRRAAEEGGCRRAVAAARRTRAMTRGRHRRAPSPRLHASPCRRSLDLRVERPAVSIGRLTTSQRCVDAADD